MEIVFFKDVEEGELSFLYQVLSQMYLLLSSLNNDEIFEISIHKEIKSKEILPQFNVHGIDIEMVIDINYN